MAKDPNKKPSKWAKGKTDPDTWWKKGDPSPNPKGRPKGSKNQKTLWKEAVQKKITVNFDGETQKMTKQELTYHQLAQKAASGDLKAIAMQMSLDEKFDPGETTHLPPTNCSLRRIGYVGARFPCSFCDFPCFSAGNTEKIQDGTTPKGRGENPAFGRPFSQNTTLFGTGSQPQSRRTAGF